jgi:hypothetical protein
VDEQQSTVTERLVSAAGDPILATAPALAKITPSQCERFAREYYGDEYRVELRRLMRLGVEPPEEDDE